MHEGTREVVTKVADAGEEDDAGDEPAPRETLCTPGIEVATNALSMSGIDPSDIDLVICATSSPDDLFGDELLHPVWGRGRRHGAHHGGRKGGGGGEGGRGYCVVGPRSVIFGPGFAVDGGRELGIGQRFCG